MENQSSIDMSILSNKSMMIEPTFIIPDASLKQSSFPLQKWKIEYSMYLPYFKIIQTVEAKFYDVIASYYLI